MESTPTNDFCRYCGKRTTAGRAGSLTQWVFRQDLCSCNRDKLVNPPVDTDTTADTTLKPRRKFREEQEPSTITNELKRRLEESASAINAPNAFARPQIMFAVGLVLLTASLPLILSDTGIYTALKAVTALEAGSQNDRLTNDLNAADTLASWHYDKSAGLLYSRYISTQEEVQLRGKQPFFDPWSLRQLQSR